MIGNIIEATRRAATTSEVVAKNRRTRTSIQNADFQRTTKRFVSLFKVRREHIFDPFHECADSAGEVAPMRYYEGHGKRAATKVGPSGYSHPRGLAPSVVSK
jgi:hypothetical protein